ncbi:MAG: S8 family serine peptidase [Bacteroidales bacterium]|nr:S8 family serine peptidase [Bacteroidales bacterium]
MMRNNIYKILLLILLLVPVYTVAQNLPELQDISEHIDQGRVRIKLKQEAFQHSTGLKSASINSADTKVTGISEIDQLNDDLGIKRIYRVFPFSLKHEVKHREYGLHLWMEIEFDPYMSPEYVAEQYSALAEVDLAKPVFKKVRLDGGKKANPYQVGSLKSIAEPTHVQRAGLKSTTDAVEFNDPLLSQQWHYFNDGTVGTVGQDIDLLKAWSITTGSDSVIVAIVDGGIDTDHEDLKENIWVNTAELNGEPDVDDDQNGYVDDVYGYNFTIAGPITPHDHGTHVAGTVGAVSNNGVGVAGVAGGDGQTNGVKMISCQVFDDRISTSGNFAAAIVYGCDNGAVISQNSWGYTIPSYYEPEVLDAVRYFIAEAGQYEGSPMKGGILFFAAGNDGLEQTHYPASFEEVVAVTATGPTGYAAPYSNSGEWTDIAAPGGDQAYFEEEGGVLSTLPDNKYGFFQGTSMACPHVSGVAALVLSKFGGDEMTPDNLRSILVSSTSRFEFEHNNKYGSGILNAANALANDEKIAPDAITDLEATDVFHNAVRIQWTIPPDEDNFEPSLIYLAISDKEINEDNFDGAEVLTFDNPFDAGTVVKLDINNLLKESNYWFAIKTADMFGNISDLSNVLKITTTDKPAFQSSKRKVEASIDVSLNTLYSTSVDFSNIGEGILSWENYVENERIYFTEEEEAEEQEEIAETLTARQQEVIDYPELLAVSPQQEMSSTLQLKSSQVEIRDDEHWKYDETVYSSGITYEEDDSQLVDLHGTNNPNVGLVVGVRFDVDYDYTFNLTHVEVPTYTNQNDKPIIVEIKKGSKDILEAETVYLQEYYNDTVEVFSMQRIPLYRPQRFEDGDIFWIVLHFPKEDQFPIGCYYRDLIYGTFLSSKDNGRTFRDVQQMYPIPLTPLVRALSTGNDGSYVFLKPGSGEINAGEEQTADIIIDASNLSNGRHLASLNIVTNDTYRPYSTIEIDVDITGHNAEIDTTTEQNFTVYQNVESELELLVDNIGLADLEIYSVTSTINGVSSDFTDTVHVASDYKRNVPFKIEAPVDGLFTGTVELATNYGEMSVPVQINVKALSTMDVALEANSIDLVYGQKGEVDLTITNSGSNNLEYSLEHYSLLNTYKNQLSNVLSYSITSSDDVGGPQANQWEDITEIGHLHNRDEVNQGDSIELNFKFPFFGEVFERVLHTTHGHVYFYEPAYENVEYPISIDPYEPNNGGLGAFAALVVDSLGLKSYDIYEYSYGDRAIITIKKQIPDNMDIVENGFDLEYQIVIYRSGVVEYRYKNVENIPVERNYTIGIVGMAPEEYAMYRNYDDIDKRVHNGLVIRFEPTVEPSLIVNASPEKRTISAGQSETVSLTIDPSFLDVNHGSYNNTIRVKGNVANGGMDLPLTVNVLGSASVNSQDTLLFDNTNLGFVGHKMLKIINTGSKAIELNSISFDDEQLTIAEALPIEIPAGSNRFIEVSFTPTKTGNVNTTATLVYDNGMSEFVKVLAVAQLDPEYTHTIADNIVVDIVNGQSASVPFSITSVGGSADLELLAVNNKYTSINSASYKKAEINNGLSLNNQYGYTWDLSDTLTYIDHKWEDISESGQNYIIESEEQQIIELPFEFPFYGEMYSKVWVSKNGYVSVNEPESDVPGIEMVEGDGISGVIAPFWSILTASDESNSVFIQLENERMLVQWNEFQGIEAMRDVGRVTFQLEMLADGSIFFHYHDIGRWGGVLDYGLESPDESEMLSHERTWILDWARIADSTTIAIAPPLKAELSSGETHDYSIDIPGDRIFYSGTYNDTVWILSNSHAQAVLEIPLQINVSGAPVIKTENAIQLKDMIYQPNATSTAEITIANLGYDPLVITHIVDDQFDDAELYDEEGKVIIRSSSSGELITPITINPWTERNITCAITLEEQKNINGTLTLISNIDDHVITITGNVIDSPIANWDASNQSYNLTSMDTIVYSFSLHNNGETPMEFNVFPAVAPSSNDNGETNIIDKVGNYSFEQPSTVDSLYLESKQVGDGIFTPQIVGSNLSFANGFIAPEGGFIITHVKTYNYLKSEGEYINIAIWEGGTMPQDSINGTELYNQNFVIDQPVDREWVYFELAEPVTIAEKDTFFIMLSPPFDRRFCGYDLNSDPSISDWSFSGVYKGNGKFAWNNNTDELFGSIWKIRPLTAGGESQWIELDQTEGVLAGGESIEISANIYGSIAGNGESEAKVLFKSNDINNSNSDFKVVINVNGAPQLDYYPNMDTDTIKVEELSDITLNYLVSDPEGDEITMELLSLEDAPKHSFKQLTNNTAQLTVMTDYASQGVYNWVVKISDSAGNIIEDEVLVEVVDNNRAPVLNEEYGVIYLNIADSLNAFSIKPGMLFTDPDGDAFQVLAGNYTPEIVDLALGSNFIDIHPLQEGTGFLAFAADDGKENGFSIYGVYVVVYNDPNELDGNPDGFINNPFESTNKQLGVYPNPVKNAQANIYYVLDEDSHNLSIEIYSMQGAKCKHIIHKARKAGSYSEQVDVSQLVNGMYLCRVIVDGIETSTTKFIISK